MPISTTISDIPDNLNEFIEKVKRYQPAPGVESDIYNRIVFERETDYPIELISNNHLENNVNWMRLIVCTVPDVMYWILYHKDQYPNYKFDYECIVLAGAIDTYIFQVAKNYIYNNCPLYLERYMFDVLKLNGCALESISLAEQTEHYVRIAVMQNGLALRYATEEFKNDKEIVKLALKSNPSAINFTPKTVRQKLNL